MNKHEIASLACKILSLYLIIQGINVLGNVLSFAVSTPQQLLTSNNGSPILSMILPFAILIIFGVLLWVFSNKLASIMVKGEACLHEDTVLKATDIQRVSFSVLGLLFLGNSIPKLVSLIFTFLLMEGGSSIIPRLLFDSQEGGSVIVQFIFGLWIFLGSQGLVNFLNNLRTAGLKREDDNE